MARPGDDEQDGTRLLRHAARAQLVAARAIDQEPALAGLDDDEVLPLAAGEQRILVTHNVADFPRILREWAAAQRSHAGVILVYRIDHSAFGLIVRRIGRWLELRPDQVAWREFPAILDRAFAGR
jgi:Domain of unknown function (DUF5615)